MPPTGNLTPGTFLLTRGASRSLGKPGIILLVLQALHNIQNLPDNCCLSSSLAWEYNDLARRREYCILSSCARVRTTGRRREAIISTRSQTCLKMGACRWGTETHPILRKPASRLASKDNSCTGGDLSLSNFDCYV